MRYFYKKADMIEGPVDVIKLDRPAEEGVITPSTPVMEEGSASWSTYESLGAVDSVSYTSAFGVLLRLNEHLDAWLGRLFRLPSFVPESDEERRVALARVSGVTCAVIWCCLALASVFIASQMSFWLFFPVVLGGVLYGFIVQHLVYQISRSTNAMIIGQRIVASSVHFARFLGTLSALFALLSFVACLIAMFAAEMTDFFLSLNALMISACMAYIHFNAEKIMMKVDPAGVSPGREFNNCFRLLLRSFAASLQITAPFLIVAAVLALGSLVMFDLNDASLMSLAGDSYLSLVRRPSVFDMLGRLMQIGICLHIPFVSWLLLSIGSWVTDLFDAVFSMSGRCSRD